MAHAMPADRSRDHFGSRARAALRPDDIINYGNKHKLIMLEVAQTLARTCTDVDESSCDC